MKSYSMKNHQLPQLFHYRKMDGALLRLRPIIDYAEVAETTLPAPACFEIGDWPFFNSETNTWQTRKNQKVTPSYHVTMMFHPGLNYSCHALLIPSHIIGDMPYINPMSEFFTATRKKIEINENNINLSNNIYDEILVLNNFLLNSIYSNSKITEGSFIPFIHLGKIKVNARIIFSALRQILLNLLCSFFEKEKEFKPFEKDDFIGLICQQRIINKYPIIDRYNYLLRIICDIDNCLKHEVLERRADNELLIKPGIRVVKLNRCTHHNLWNIPEKEIDLIGDDKKQFWTYAVEYDALITQFSRFLCDFLEIKDPETERRPPVFFQIQEQWSLSDTLPIDKDSNRNKNGTRNKKRKRN